MSRLPSINSSATANLPVAIALSRRGRAHFFRHDFIQDAYPCLITWHEYDVSRPEVEWRQFLQDVRPAVIIGDWEMPPLTGSLLAECPELRYLCYVAGSVRGKVDRSFLERGGIVTNWGASVSPMIAECALMLALMGLRQATRFYFELHHEKAWRNVEPHPPLTLFHRKVGLHGFGAVAQALLPLLAPFHVSIEAYSEQLPPEFYKGYSIVPAKDLHALYRDNDVLFILEGLSPRTRGSVNSDVLAELCPGSVLVNVARGGLVDEEALIRLAQKGEVQIGLDVYATEPLPADSPLRGLRNVTLLPHIAGPTIDGYPLCGERALANLRNWLCGAPLTDSVTLQRYDAST